jgi:hypothetical protein
MPQSTTRRPCHEVILPRLRHFAPLAFDAGDANFYRYALNNPTNATDPSGLDDRDQPFGSGLEKSNIPDYLKEAMKSSEFWKMADEEAAKKKADRAPDIVIEAAGVKKKDSNADKLKNLIAYFSQLNVRVGDSPWTIDKPYNFPGYWREGRIEGHPGMINCGNGTCGAWSEFFLAVAKRAGITDDGKISMAVVDFVPPASPQLLMVGKDWSIKKDGKVTALEDRPDFPTTPDLTITLPGEIAGNNINLQRKLSQTDTIVNKPRSRAQNNDQPSAALFPDHAIVLIREGDQVYFFDPSYGITSEKFDVSDKTRKIRQLVRENDPGEQKALVSYENKAFGGIMKLDITPPKENGEQTFKLYVKKFSSKGSPDLTFKEFGSVLEK